MATFNWTTTLSADWNNAASWSSDATPNDISADVIIDAGPMADIGAPNNYVVTIATGESITVNTLALNPVNNHDATNTPDYNAAMLEIDGTLTFAPGSDGDLGGSLQSEIGMTGGTIVNIGTIDGFIQTSGDVLLTGTNGLYVTNWLQAQGGTVTIDTKSIAEMTGNTLFDGIFEAASGATIHFGGPLEDLIVNIQTIEGPPAIPDGWTELFLDDPATVVDEWNGTGYVSIESSLTDIGARGTVDLLRLRDWTTSNTMSIDGGLLNNQGGTFTALALDINSGAVQGNGVIAAPVLNNGTLMVEGGTLAVTGALTGTGKVAFDTDLEAGAIIPGGATAILGAVAAGQTIVMNGDDTLVLTNPGQFLGQIQATLGDKIVLTGQTITSAIDTNGTLVLSNGGTVIASLLLAGSYAAGELTANGSIVSIGTASGNSGTITESSSAITVASGATQTINGVSNIITAGSGANVTVVGSSNIVNADTGGIFSFNGGGERLNGSNETVSTTTAESGVTVIGNGNTIDASSVAGSAFELNGTGDISHASNGTIYADDGASFTMTGSGNAIGFSGVGTIVSSTNTIYLTSSSADVDVIGNGNAIGAVAGSTLALDGTNTSIYASDMTLTGATGSTMFVAGTGDTANFGGAASIAISNGTINATGSAAAISIAGDNNVVNDTFADSAVELDGTGDVVNMSGGTIYAADNASFTVAGSSDAIGFAGVGTIASSANTIYLTSSSANVGVIGSNNAIGAVAGSTLTLNGVNNSVYASDMTILGAVGSTMFVAGTGDTANFEGAASIAISGGTINATSTAAAISIAGSNNVVNDAFAGSAVELDGTGDIVNMSGGTIYAADNASFSVTGSSDAIGFAGLGTIISSANTIYLTSSSAAVDVIGNGNAIGAVAGSRLTLDGTNTSIYGSGMTISGAAGSTMFVAGTGDTANFGGAASIAISNGTINATGAGASISINGDNNVVNDTFAGSVVGITGSNETVTASGITLYGGANTSMTLIGTSDTVGLDTNSRLVVASASNIAFVTGASHADQIVVGDQSQTVTSFDPTAGDRIDLSQILSGESVTADTLGSFVSASSANGNTSLSIVGLHGSDTVVLAGVGSLSLATLTNENAFILPTQPV